MTTTNEHTERARFESWADETQPKYWRTTAWARDAWQIWKAAAMLEAQRPALKPLTGEQIEREYQNALNTAIPPMDTVAMHRWWFDRGVEAAHGIKEQA